MYLYSNFTTHYVFLLSYPACAVLLPVLLLVLLPVLSLLSYRCFYSEPKCRQLNAMVIGVFSNAVIK